MNQLKVIIILLCILLAYLSISNFQKSVDYRDLKEKIINYLD